MGRWYILWFGEVYIFFCGGPLEHENAAEKGGKALGLLGKGPTLLLADNQAANQVASDNARMKKALHVERKYHKIIKDICDNEVVLIPYYPERTSATNI